MTASHDDTLNPDGSPDSSTTWHSNSGTNYDGIIECFSGSASDSEIGIEATDWNGISGGCESWSSTGSYSVYYEAWDFANNRGKSSSYTITVKHDSSSPTAKLAIFASTTAPNSPSGGSNNVWHAYDPSGFGEGNIGAQGYEINEDETGLINCDDGGAYDWSGDLGTNGEWDSCNASGGGTYYYTGEYEIEITVTDYHGNTVTKRDGGSLFDDPEDPYWGLENGNNEFRIKSTSSRCIYGDDDETGKWKVEGSRCADAKQENCDEGDSYTEDTVTPTVYDNHGNSQEGKLTVYEECEGDDGGGGGGGGEIQSIAPPLPR